ncbi:hypothetical protein [Limnothrix redekei]|uniref:Uncharacterized protein n=1 Tax=Limnothrix redekei LRLZ20PSL1 TaxID=3112953 RepID=A0ABW7CAG8_9CYAN
MALRRSLVSGAIEGINPPLDGGTGVVAGIAEFATKLLAATLSRKSAAETAAETVSETGFSPLKSWLTGKLLDAKCQKLNFGEFGLEGRLISSVCAQGFDSRQAKFATPNSLKFMGKLRQSWLIFREYNFFFRNLELKPDLKDSFIL